VKIGAGVLLPKRAGPVSAIRIAAWRRRRATDQWPTLERSMDGSDLRVLFTYRLLVQAGWTTILLQPLEPGCRAALSASGSGKTAASAATPVGKSARSLPSACGMALRTSRIPWRATRAKGFPALLPVRQAPLRRTPGLRALRSSEGLCWRRHTRRSSSTVAVPALDRASRASPGV